MTVVERVFEAMKRRRLTERALALKAGLSSGYLTHLKRGDDEAYSAHQKIVSPRIESVEKLAEALDVPASWLLFGGEEPDWDSAEESP